MMDPSNNQLQNYLPLREPSFFILLSLAGGDQHGYAILKLVEQLSQRRLKLSTGTLYEALARMMDQHWIEPVEHPIAEKLPESDRRNKSRKSYHISPLGMRILEAELSRMQTLVAMARLHLAENDAQARQTE